MKKDVLRVWQENNAQQFADVLAVTNDGQAMKNFLRVELTLGNQHHTHIPPVSAV